jgi:hypothetical protein
MDIKRKTCDIRTWKKLNFFLDISTNIDTLVPLLYQPVETRSIEIFWLSFQPLRYLRFVICDFLKSLREFLDPVVNRFSWQTLPTVNRKHLFINILCTEYFDPQKKTHNRTLLFSSIHTPQLRCHFNYWNQPLNMSMRVCYLDCHEAGLCCYLVIHIENLLRSLRLLYSHLLHIYWLSLVPSS